VGVRCCMKLKGGGGATLLPAVKCSTADDLRRAFARSSRAAGGSHHLVEACGAMELDGEEPLQLKGGVLEGGKGGAEIMGSVELSGGNSDVELAKEVKEEQEEQEEKEEQEEEAEACGVYGGRSCRKGGREKGESSRRDTNKEGEKEDSGAGGGGMRSRVQGVDLLRRHSDARWARDNNLVCLKATSGAWDVKDCSIRSEGAVAVSVQSWSNVELSACRIGGYGESVQRAGLGVGVYGNAAVLMDDCAIVGCMAGLIACDQVGAPIFPVLRATRWLGFEMHAEGSSRSHHAKAGSRSSPSPSCPFPSVPMSIILVS